VTYRPDANELATREERRARSGEKTAVMTGYGPPRGTLTIWQSGDPGFSHTYQSLRVTIDLKHPNQIIAYDDLGDAEIFMLEPGAYVNFVLDREGE
jgi:hypothetical protein